MAIDPPMPQDTRSRLADWLELETLIRPRGVATRSDVLRLYDFMEDAGHELEFDELTGEELETEILEHGRSECADEVLAEIEHRAQTLDADYPFDIELVRHQWRLSVAEPVQNERIRAARTCYRFCLLASTLRDGRISGNTAAVQHLMANHFQAIATDAAAGVLNGQAISFGFPRPSGLGFRAALADASQQMRLGTPLETMPLHSNGQEKDAGIDVIAWRDFRDGRPSKLVLLGQVASGHDWKDKSVLNDKYRFYDWFRRRPTEHPIASIFIPFPLHHECQGQAGIPFEDVAVDTAYHLEHGFGIVVDRLRIVETAAPRLAESHNEASDSTLSSLHAWTEEVLNLARELL